MSPTYVLIRYIGITIRVWEHTERRRIYYYSTFVYNIAVYLGVWYNIVCRLS